MAFNLLDSVKGLLGGDLASKAAGLLGENTGNVQKAFTGIIPSVLAGIVGKSSSGDSQGVFSMAIDAAKHAIPENLAGLMPGGGGLASSDLAAKGTNFLSGLFGDKLSSIAGAISSFSGVSQQSATSLMSVAAPAALGELGKHAIDTNMNPSSLGSFLSSQKDSIMAAMPSGLNLGGLLGLGGLAGIANKVTGVADRTKQGASAVVADVEEKARGNRWALPLILLLLAVAIIWYLMRRHEPDQANVAPADTAVKVVDSPVTAPVASDNIQVKLPDGVVLQAWKGGIEDQLVNFLNDPASKAGKDVWFDFDKLTFKTGSADIAPESQTQIDNLKAILKAYPKLKLKIGGYTDRTGDSLANLKLSGTRAASVATSLKAGGDAAQIVGAEGYGSQFAKAMATDPDSLRVKDRHISVSVREK